MLHFVSETRAKGLPVTRQAMQLKAGEIAKALGIDEAKFKATRGWCDRFMRRAGLSLSVRPRASKAFRALTSWQCPAPFKAVLYHQGLDHAQGVWSGGA